MSQQSQIWRKIVSDICFTGFGTVLTTILLFLVKLALPDKGNNKITELRTILQRESQNS
jgi:hypothetical protein